MNQKQFQFQVERLKNVYGENNYKSERVMMLEKSFINLNYEDFKSAIDELISNQKFAPLKNQIAEAVSLVTRNRSGGSLPPGCFRCSNTGRIFVSKPDGHSYAYACTCALGQQYSTSHLSINSHRGQL